MQVVRHRLGRSATRRAASASPATPRTTRTRAPAANAIGCQDCHDEHAEGSGTASNYFMIPESSKKDGTYIATPRRARAKAGAEPVIYDMPRKDPTTGALNTGAIDFYAPARGGRLRQHRVPRRRGLRARCRRSSTAHAAAPARSSSARTAPAATRTTATRPGGWRATASCNDCHSYPGLPTTDSDHILSGVHTRHVEARADRLRAAPARPATSTTTTTRAATRTTSRSGTTPTCRSRTINIRFDTSAGKLDAGATNLTYNGGDADVGTNGERDAQRDLRRAVLPRQQHDASRRTGRARTRRRPGARPTRRRSAAATATRTRRRRRRPTTRTATTWRCRRTPATTATSRSPRGDARQRHGQHGRRR